MYWLDLDGTFPVDGYLEDEFLHNTTVSLAESLRTGGALWTK